MGSAKFKPEIELPKIQKFSWYSENIYENRYLSDEKNNCEKKICHYLTYFVINLISLIIALTTKTSWAAIKIKILYTLTC